MFYMPNEVDMKLLDAVTALAAIGSWLGFDVVNNITLTSPYTIKWVQMQASLGAPWIGTMDEPEAVQRVAGMQP